MATNTNNSHTDKTILNNFNLIMFKKSDIEIQRSFAHFIVKLLAISNL